MAVFLWLPNQAEAPFTKSKIRGPQNQRRPMRSTLYTQTYIHRQPHTPHWQGHASLIHHSNKQPSTCWLLSATMHLLLVLHEWPTIHSCALQHYVQTGKSEKSIKRDERGDFRNLHPICVVLLSSVWHPVLERRYPSPLWATVKVIMTNEVQTFMTKHGTNCILCS